MFEALKNHWREYLIEAWGLGAFMVSACVFGVLIFNPGIAPQIQNPYLQRTLMGLAMGATAIGIICSPWGKRSGAHINPAVTLAFFRLGKIKASDAVFYIIAQFAGGTIGVLLSWVVLGVTLENSAVNFVVTVPGEQGNWTALAAELIISFLLMLVVLVTSNSTRLARWTPYFAGILVALFIIFEAPLSGMSMNPARSFASTIVANNWSGWWIYFVAPITAMLLAAEVYVRALGLHSVICAKLHHRNSQACIFICGYAAAKSDAIEVTRQPHLFTTSLQLF
jgi:aquaporin Z